MIIVTEEPSEKADLNASSNSLLPPPPPPRRGRSPSPGPSRSVPPPPLHPTHKYGSESSLLPPNYTAADSPKTNQIYAFSRGKGNSMILNSETMITESPWTISVFLNCFTPTSYITTITREGEVIAEFEMCSLGGGHENTVSMKGNEAPMADLLQASRRLFGDAWTWKISNHRAGLTTLYWDDSTAGGGALTCFMSKERIAANLLGKFTPRSHLKRPGVARTDELAKLEVTPFGFDVFDDILVSALVIERIRTLPGK